MYAILLIAGLTYRDCLRKKALHGILAFGLLILLANLVVTSTFSWEPGKVAVDIGLSAVSLSGLLIIFFLAIDSLFGDIERQAIHMILSRPISRGQYLLGKFCGLAALLATSSLVLGLLASISVKVALSLSHAVSPEHFTWTAFLLGLLFQALGLWMMLALTVCWCTLTTHPFTAVLLSAISYFVAVNIESIQLLVSRQQLHADNPALHIILRVAGWLFPNLSAFDLKTAAAYGLSSDPGYLLALTAYSLAYITILLLFSVIIFQRRDLG